MNTQETVAINIAQNPELKLSEKTWFHVLMIFLFWPVGLYLIVKTKRYSKKVRYGVPIAFLCLFLIALFAPSDESGGKSTPYDFGHFQMTSLLSKAKRDPGSAGVFSFVQMCKTENKTVRSYTDEQTREWERGMWDAYQEYLLDKAMMGGR